MYKSKYLKYIDKIIKLQQGGIGDFMTEFSYMFRNYILLSNFKYINKCEYFKCKVDKCS